jgi:acyl-CoA thioesterase-1
MIMLKKLLPSLLLCLSLLGVKTAFAAKNILIVGDSLSAGYGIPTGEGWVALLQKRLGSEYTVQNVSVSGHTTSNGLASLPQALEEYHPVVTIIELGGNDGLRGIPLATIQSQFSTMIELAQKNKSKVLLLGVRLPPNYGPEYTQKFQKIYSDLGKKYSISVVPLFLKNIDTNPKLMQADGIHPVAAAQPLMLDNVWSCLEPLLNNKSQKICNT